MMSVGLRIVLLFRQEIKRSNDASDEAMKQTKEIMCEISRFDVWSCCERANGNIIIKEY